MMLESNKEANAATVDPEFIVSVRKEPALDQPKAYEVVGGGVTAFSRYEHGKTDGALLRLLRAPGAFACQIDEPHPSGLCGRIPL